MNAEDSGEQLSRATVIEVLKKDLAEAMREELDDAVNLMVTARSAASPRTLRTCGQISPRTRASSSR